jgi:hypothetical protein
MIMKPELTSYIGADTTLEDVRKLVDQYNTIAVLQFGIGKFRINKRFSNGTEFFIINHSDLVMFDRLPITEDMHSIKGFRNGKQYLDIRFSENEYIPYILDEAALLDDELSNCMRSSLQGLQLVDTLLRAEDPTGVDLLDDDRSMYSFAVHDDCRGEGGWDAICACQEIMNALKPHVKTVDAI